MSKVIFTADIHFGVPGRREDILLACKAMRAYAHKNKIDTVVILGDLYHDRRALEIDVLNLACDFFMEAQEMGQQWIAFPGNHDMFLKHSWDMNSLKPLQKYLTVIDEVSILQLDNQRFWIVPFITFEKSYMAVINHIDKELRQDGDKLLTHIGINSATLNTCFLLKDWSIINFEQTGFDKIYTGHFHSYQQVGDKIWYPGSPIPFKFDEGDVPHGFLLYDTEKDTHEFIDIWETIAEFYPNDPKPPQYCTILDEQVNQLERQDVEGNIVRIVLQQDITEDEKRTIREKVKNLGAKLVRLMNYYDSMAVEKTQKEDIKQQDLFRAFIKIDKNAKTLDERLLIHLHDEIAKEGDELALSEQEDN